MAKLRRSARLSRTTGRQDPAADNAKKTAPLPPLVEREGSSDTISETSNDPVISPSVRPGNEDLLFRLNELRTPQTEPRPDHTEMNPKTVHQSTTRAPDSGLRLGFADIENSARAQKTPSKSTDASAAWSRAQPLSPTNPSASQFQFASKPTLSAEAQKIMASVKADAAQIKKQMLTDKVNEASNIGEPNRTANSARKIATAKGKTSRFSDVHMEQFRKMDSIENHPSAFRARPGFTAQSSQSLKRKSSRADLEEPVRPRTAGKGTPLRHPGSGYPKASTASPVKRQPGLNDTSDESASTTKRARQTKEDDVSTQRSVKSKPSSSTLYSPTKSSMARVENIPRSSSSRLNILPRSSSIRFSKSNPTMRAVPNASAGMKSSPTIVAKLSPAKLPQSQSLQFKPLPALPVDKMSEIPRSKSSTSFKFTNKPDFTSKFPSFSNLKSILRSGLKAREVGTKASIPIRSPAQPQFISSPKKVDFTPSVKSRYAVKLAAESPVPAKLRQGTPHKAAGPFGVPYDASAYTLSEDEGESSEEENCDVVYPELPSLTDHAELASHSFSNKAKELNRRESQEFRSIFTDLRPDKQVEGNRLTAINTAMNKTDPNAHARNVSTSIARTEGMASSSTIRQVRNSGISELLQPFAHDKRVSHSSTTRGKRRFESIGDDNDTHGPSSQQGFKKRKSSAVRPLPGAWTDTILEDEENQDPLLDVSEERATKRIRTSSAVETSASPAKKPNVAREIAAKNAKERKGKGLMSLSRLNFLSRPKSKS